MTIREENVDNKDDAYFMQEALTEAQKAFKLGEVPVGAVVVHNGEIVGRGHNYRENGKDATLHAEMIAIREACRNRGGWRLPGDTIYVTLEPCPMCAGAMVQARLRGLVFAARDKKAGAAGSVTDLVRMPAFNHQLEVRTGIGEQESVLLLQQFFKGKRQKRNEDKVKLSEKAK